MMKGFISSQRLQADLMLLAVSIIWGSAFVVQRITALRMGVFLFNGLRFLIAAMVLIPFVIQSWGNFNRKQWLGVALAGMLLFAGATLQQSGLRFTTAGNAGFITGLYVILIPLILAFGLRQIPPRVTWLASVLAACGLFLLSTGGKLELSSGDSLEFAGAWMWAFHVIVIGWLVQHVNVLQLAAGQYLVCGLLSTLIGLGVEAAYWEGIAGSLWALAYTGVISVGLGYTLQAAGQRVAPPADAALILCTEAVFAAFFGWLVLDERLAIIQLMGCGLMLGGMILAQANAIAQKKA